MKPLFLVAFVFALTACGGVQHKPMQSEANHRIYALDCGGFNHMIDVCMEKAAELCTTGFSVVKDRTYAIEYPVSPDGFYKYPTKVVTIECDAKST